MHRTTTSRTPHFTNCTAFHMLHILHSFHHIWPWSHPVSHPTTMFHITFHITHQYTTTTKSHHLSRTTPPPLPRIAPCYSPRSTSFHIAQRSTFRATAHVPIHGTPQLSITPIPVWETRNYVIRFVLSHTTVYTTYQTNTKMVVKKITIHKVPEKVMPVCPKH